MNNNEEESIVLILLLFGFVVIALIARLGAFDFLFCDDKCQRLKKIEAFNRNAYLCRREKEIYGYDSSDCESFWESYGRVRNF